MMPSERLNNYWIELSIWRSQCIQAKEHRQKMPPMPIPDPVIAPLVEEEFRHRYIVSQLWTEINGKSET